MEPTPKDQAQQTVAELKARLEDLTRQCQQLRAQNAKLVRKSIDLADMRIEMEDKNYELEQVRAELESRVTDRTQELLRKNENLKRHIFQRRQAEARLQELTREQEGLLRDAAKAHEELCKREEWYRTTFEHTGTAMALLEADATISMANSRFETLSGYSRQELEGKRKWTEFVDPQDLQIMLGYHHSRRDQGEAPTEYEFMFLDRFGNRRQILNTVQIIPGSNKSIASLIDITERKQTEAALRDSEKRFRELFDNISDAIFISDLHGKMLEVSQTACQRLGYSRAELLALRVEQIESPEFAAVALQRIQAVNDAGSMVFESAHLAKDGRQIPVELHARRIQFLGAPALMTVARDISQRKQAEADLKRQAGELAALNALGRDISRTLSLERTISAALAGALEALSPDLAFIFVREGDRLILKDFQPRKAGTDSMAAREHQIGQCLCGLAARDNQALFSEDICADQRCTWPECQQAGFRSLAVLPLSSGNENIGALGLASMAKRDFAQQTKFLETLAAQVSVAIANARLFEAVSRELAERQRAVQALQESEDRFRLLSDESPLGISLISSDGRYEYINQAFVNTFGYSLSDIPTGPDWLRLAFPDQGYRQRVRSQWLGDLGKSAFGQWRVRSYEVRCKDGQSKTVLFRPVTIAGGRQMVIYEDISDRLAAEKALRESEEKFSRIFRNSPVWITLSTLEDGRYLDVNEAFTRGTGWSRQEVLGSTSKDIGLWQDNAHRDQGLRMLEREGRIWEVPFHFCKKTGEKGIGLWSAESIDMGGTRCLVSVVNDVTERYGAEEALRLSERRYRDLFDSISDLICTHDLEGNLLTINQTACDAVGRPARELVGINLKEFIWPQSREAFDQEYLPSIIASGGSQGVTKYMDKNGRVRYLEYRNRLITEAGKEPFVIGSARDVTERILAEREMRRLEEQLLQAQKIEALGTLASGIAHDFNNVLQAISGYAQLMLTERKLTDISRERLHSIERTIERAATMIKQLMTMAHKAEMRRDPVDLNHEVAQTVKILEHTLPRMIGIRMDLAPDLKPVLGDPGQFDQVVLNLATNAGHAMPQGGELSLRTRNVTLTAEDCKSLQGLEPGFYVALEVADTGKGMDEEIRTRIFDPFFTTKPVGEGTGLGLTMVYSIVANHGGNIHCRSRLGRGTTFTLYFPIADQVGSAHPEAAAKVRRNLTGNETILLVDDESAILHSTREALESLGYQVLTASSGEEALELFLARHQAVDLVIMDLNMPGGGGLDSMQRMSEARPGTKIIAATGFADVNIKESVAAAGGLGLVAKPYKFTELLATIRNTLDNK